MPHKTAGQTMPIWIKPEGCFGLSNKNMDRPYLGPTCSFWPVTLPWKVQDLRHLGLPVDALTPGNHKQMYTGGSEDKFLANDKRWKDGELEKPLAAVQLGLIYVNPQGPNGNPDPLASAKNIRISFGRMGMNDEETVALIAGGHTLGKAHGQTGEHHLGPSPEGASIENMGLGWMSDHGTGIGPDATTSGLELVWTETPVAWSHGFFEALWENEWELVKSPGGAWQFEAVNPEKMYPDAFDPNKKHKPGMLVSDIALIRDPIYKEISKRFYENPEEFDKAFARAWFKLTHRDMGPRSTYLGPEIPEQEFTWQDPLPQADYETISEKDITFLKKKISKSGLTVEELVNTAWSSAATYRDSDRRGGGQWRQNQVATPG